METRIALSGVTVGGVSADDGPGTPILEGAPSLPLAALGQLAPPTNITLGWSSKAGMADCLAFDFGSQSLANLSWQVLENGLPVAVDTQLYDGGATWALANAHWQTEIAAKSFDPGQMSPVVLPTYWAYYRRAQTAGNRYEIQLIRRDPTTHDVVETTTVQAGYGQFKGATADCVNETQAGTVTLLELDLDDRNFAQPAFAGVAGVRAYQGEQLAALILDASTKASLTIGDLGFRIATMKSDKPLPELQQAAFTVTVNREGVVTTELSPVVDKKCTLTIDTAILAGNGGMVSLCIRNTNPGSGEKTAPRYLGIIVKDRDGNVPASPETLTIGAVNENSAPGQQFFRGDSITGGGANPVGFQQFDSQYIYLNGGPVRLPDGTANSVAWRTSSGGYDGKKLIQSLRESAKFGAVPTVVYYNIMTKFSTDAAEPGEGPFTALRNISNENFMVEYFKDLKFTIETIRSFANGATVALVIEPDFLAYMMQEARKSSGVYADPGSADYTYQTDPQKSKAWGGTWNIGDPIVAMTSAAYTAGFLPDPGAGNRLPDTLPGLIEAINRGMRYLATTTNGTTAKAMNLEYGWKFNLWAYDVPGVNSLMKATDSSRLGWAFGRAAIATAARAVADWYEKAGILTGETGQTMDFIAMDKYGTDGGANGGGYPQTSPGYTNPAAGNYFYNADHWNNYLLYARTLHAQLDDLPVRLWQIPIGHVNQSTYTIGGQQVSALANTDKKWEDSAVDFFFGDTFTGKSTGRDDAAAVEFFKTDTLGTVVTFDEQTQQITWSSQLKAAAEAGIQMIMFGPGLAGSTQGGGYSSDPPLDNWFWASKVKDYYAAGGLFIERPSAVLNRADGQSATSGDSEIHFTVAFSHAVSGFTAEDVTLSGTAGTIEGATVNVETIVGGIEYDVTVTLRDSASTCTGDVIATIAAEVVQDKDGNNNLASTGTANTVRYTPSAIGGQGRSNAAQIPGGGEPLPGVHVSLASTIPGGFVERTTTTDDDGYYEFENVPNGVYQVTVTPPSACFDTGSDTTVVSAEGSQTYSADFAFGALRPACIPNRMLATTSYPVGSVRWHQVVEEAVALGDDAVGQGTQLAAAEPSQAASVQYLTLAPQTVNVATPDVPVVDEADMVVADEAQVETESEPVVNTRAAAIPTAVSVAVPIVDEGEAVVVDTTPVQADSLQEQVVEAVVACTVASSEAATIVEDHADVFDTTPVPGDSQFDQITPTALALIVEEAIVRWEAAGADQAALDRMQNALFLMSDLDGLYLGMTQGNTVWLDGNAAGCGWFVDPTPSTDEEFRETAAGSQQRAVDLRALDRIDLLTAVAHELGHVTGLRDSNLDVFDLMNPHLSPGVRRDPSLTDAALAAGLWDA